MGREEGVEGVKRGTERERVVERVRTFESRTQRRSYLASR